jgi:hypothetical protein
MKLTAENRSTRGKTCPSATLCTRNPTWTDPGSNPGFRGGRPATNRLAKISALRHCHKRSMQGPYSAAHKNFRSGLRTYQSKCRPTKLNFLFNQI